MIFKENPKPNFVQLESLRKTLKNALVTNKFYSCCVHFHLGSLSKTRSDPISSSCCRASISSGVMLLTSSQSFNRDALSGALKSGDGS